LMGHLKWAEYAGRLFPKPNAHKKPGTKPGFLYMARLARFERATLIRNQFVSSPSSAQLVNRISSL